MNHSTPKKFCLSLIKTQFPRIWDNAETVKILISGRIRKKYQICFSYHALGPVRFWFRPEENIPKYLLNNIKIAFSCFGGKEARICLLKQCYREECFLVYSNLSLNTLKRNNNKKYLFQAVLWIRIRIILPDPDRPINSKHINFLIFSW